MIPEERTARRDETINQSKSRVQVPGGKKREGGGETERIVGTICHATRFRNATERSKSNSIEISLVVQRARSARGRDRSARGRRSRPSRRI